MGWVSALTNSSPMPRDAPCTMETPPAGAAGAADEKALTAVAIAALRWLPRIAVLPAPLFRRGA